MLEGRIDSVGYTEQENVLLTHATVPARSAHWDDVTEKMVKKGEQSYQPRPWSGADG